MTKPDRKALMRKSLQDDSENAEQRFAAAEAAMSTHPQGLMSRPVLSSFRAETGSSDTEGRLVRLPIDRVHDNPFNARHIYDIDAVKELALSLATRQLVPAPVVPHPSLDGHYVLIDGHYRKKGLLAAGKHEIECIIHPPQEDLELYRRSFQINEQRNAQFPLDNAMAWRQLLETKMVKSSDGIAEMLGMSKSTVSKTLAMLDLPECVLIKMREKPSKFSLGIGYELALCAKSMDEVELLVLMDRIVDEDISTRQLADIRAKIDAKPDRKPKETSRQYKIRQDGAQIGVIKEWDSGKITLEIKLTDIRQREALLELLKRHFGLEENLFK